MHGMLASLCPILVQLHYTDAHQALVGKGIEHTYEVVSWLMQQGLAWFLATFWLSSAVKTQQDVLLEGEAECSVYEETMA